MLDWDLLHDIDRFIYRQQKGAPSGGSTLPIGWEKLKHELFETGLITLDELNSLEATVAIKESYEHVRLGVNKFFGAEAEATDKREWTVFYAEGLDVYDLNPGSKYFGHQRLSIAHAQRTRANEPPQAKPSIEV